MSFTLNAAELRQLEQSIQTLVSPLDYGTLDQWRSAVNRTLSSLLHADSAGFLLPVREGLALYSEEHDPAALARYPDVPPPPTHAGITMWEAMIKHQVMTNAGWFGEHYHLYLDSPYYNEYAGANGAHDTLAASMSLGGVDARSMAAMHFWHERPDGRLFGEREIALLRLLYPAFTAGVRSALWWRAESRNLNETFEWLDQPAMVASATGQVLHVNASLDALLADDREAPAIRHQLLAAIREVSGARTRVLAGHAPGRTEREVTTSAARYRIVVFQFGARAFGTESCIIAALQRLSAAIPSCEQLQARFGLTLAQSRVARMIAEGKSNKEIANELGISVHTAHRHTEKIFLKLNAKSRSEVSAMLHR